MQPDEMKPASHHHASPSRHKPAEVPAPDKAVKSINRALIVSGGLLTLVVLIAITSYLAFRTNPNAATGNKASASTLLPVSTAPAVVSITGAGFTPTTVSVKVNQAVVWTNSDSTPHFVTSDDPKPIGNAPHPDSTQALNPNDSYSYVFTKAGTYTYHDSLSTGFTGTIVVK